MLELASSILLLFLLSVVTDGYPNLQPSHHPSTDDCIINTTSGFLRPLIEPEYPDVDQYLGIPFASPPLNDLRFASPQPVKRSSKIIDATKLPPGCYQPPSIFNSFSIYEPGLTFYGPQSEDCLKLNVYRPKTKAKAPLPVIIFVYGGGFDSGATNISYEIPTPWVQEKRDLVVVNIQYRVNIFGFPNSAALDEQNLGLQDIRLAVQWVKENVGAFGGDPDKITLWGHSAGSIATNAYTYSNIDDQLVQGTISTSGTTFTPREGWQSLDTHQSNFTYVANQLGCTGNAEAQLKCMRSKPASTIADFVYKYNGTNKLTFKPIADEKYVFANYTTRLLEGKVARQPAIIGNSRNEGERSLDTNTNPNGPNQTLAQAYTIAAFLCPGQLTSKLRHEIGVPTYRYEWWGNFTNISPLDWMGAYHASLLPFFFGQTNSKISHPKSGESTMFELEVGSYMQDLWRAFAMDPKSLAEKFDWPLYQGGNPGNKTDAVKLIPGRDGESVSSLEFGAEREEYCGKVDEYLIEQKLPEGGLGDLGQG